MLSIDLKGKLAIVAGVADDQGFGWAIAKSLNAAGAKVIIACWPPALNILNMSLKRNKLDLSLPDGGTFEIEKIYPLDAVYDSLNDAPEDIRNNKRYADVGDFSMEGLRDSIVKDFGDQQLNIAIHSLANGPEVAKPLSETSRAGYLAANSASAYSFVSFIQKLSPIMKPRGSFLALSYLASQQVIPGYGGGMSSAKASLESDTKVLAYEIGRKFKHRINTISAGPWASRAARSIGFVNEMIEFSNERAPLAEPMTSSEVGDTVAFLSSDLASGITATNIFVDKGMHSMGLGPN